MTACLNPCPKSVRTVHVQGPLRVPASRSLRDDVHALLRRGERRIVLDLSAVPRIDASGIGELIRTFNMTTATNGGLRIVNATAWVREMLERAQVFALLSGETEVEPRLAAGAAYAMWRRQQVPASLAVSLPHEAASSEGAA